jgi:parallel beta-helix repeat protein
MYKKIFTVLFLAVLCFTLSFALSINAKAADATSQNVLDANTYGAVGDGTTDNTEVFQRMINVAGIDDSSIQLSKGIYRLANSLTIPSNITLSFDAGAIISMDLSNILTVNGTINAGISQIFTDTSLVKGGKVASGVYPQWFGATGNGTTNDTKAVQAAIDFSASLQGNNVVVIPDGIYNVKNLWYKQGMSIRGNGANSILKANETSIAWNYILNCENITGVKIDGVTFDGNKGIVPGDDQSGIFNLLINTCSDVSITNCTFQHNWYLGICVMSSNGLLFDSNRFLDLDCGILTSGYPSNNMVINGNYLDGAIMSEPISIYGMKEGYHNNITITNNTIKNHTAGSGILLRAVKNVLVKNNTIDNNCTGILCTTINYNGVDYGVYNATIEDNTILNSVYEGILLKNISDSKILNNRIENAGTYGILTFYVSNCDLGTNKVINSNAKVSTGVGGILINGLKNSRVYSNEISVNKTDVTYRGMIYLSGTASIIEGNTFTSNIGYPSTIKVYGADATRVMNNTFDEASTFDDRKVSSVSVTGSATIKVSKTSATGVQYKATVFDQYGSSMTNQNVIWSVTSLVADIKISSNGVVTVPKGTKATSFTVKAVSSTNNSVLATLTVTLR